MSFYSEINKTNYRDLYDIFENLPKYCEGVYKIDLNEFDKEYQYKYKHLLNKFTNLIYLNCSFCYIIEDNDIINLNIQILNCENCEKITDESIKHFTELTDLNCSGCNHITDESIIKLKNLKTLTCYYCKNITTKSTGKLKKLKYLYRINYSDFFYNVAEEWYKNISNYIIAPITKIIL